MRLNRNVSVTSIDLEVKLTDEQFAKGLARDKQAWAQKDLSLPVHNLKHLLVMIGGVDIAYDHSPYVFFGLWDRPDQQRITQACNIVRDYAKGVKVDTIISRYELTDFP